MVMLPGLWISSFSPHSTGTQLHAQRRIQCKYHAWRECPLSRDLLHRLLLADGRSQTWSILLLHQSKSWQSTKNNRKLGLLGPRWGPGIRRTNNRLHTNWGVSNAESFIIKLPVLPFYNIIKSGSEEKIERKMPTLNFRIEILLKKRRDCIIDASYGVDRVDGVAGPHPRSTPWPP